MIYENSIPDIVMFRILKKLRKKWGMKIVVKNMRQHLIERKQYFEPYFQNVPLNMDSSECFEDKSGTKLPRYVIYCTDPVEVSNIIREKIPNFNEEEYFIVLGVDGGKNNLKICLNWSKRTKDDGKYKLMGPKHSIILASVCYVPETYHNIKVLFNLLKVEKLNFKLSTDLKLVNIIKGKQSAAC